VDVIRKLIRPFGLLCVLLATLLGLFALFGLMVSDDNSGRVVAGVVGGVALLFVLIGVRALRYPAHRRLIRSRVRPAVPATDKQLRYARKLGIAVTPTMSKEDVSAAIGAAERANPRLAQQRERIKSKARERKFGPELIAEEYWWNEFAESTEYMLAIYWHGKEMVVDVLRVNEAWINDRGKLVLGAEAPKVVKDRHIGQHLDWDRYFELLREHLLHFDPLGADFYAHDSTGFGSANKAYQEAVRRGLKIARRL